MEELTVAATIDSIDKITLFVDEQLDGYGCPMKIQQQMNLAIEEIVSNIAQYAYIDGGSVTVRVELSEDNSAVSISFIDSGIKYNPLTKDNPDITLSADEREIGGLGIYLFKKLMDAVSYEYKDGKNILRIEKKIGY